MLEDLSKSMFSENVNSTFHLLRHAAEPPLALELIECRAGVSQPNYEQFSLLFKGSSAAVIPQCTYELEHPILGTFMLFLVPIKQDKNGTYYESVFNRLVQSKAGSCE